VADFIISNIDSGEKRPFKAHGHATLVHAGATTLLRGVFEPGWRWSNDVAPIAGTTSCQVHHLGLALSGEMGFKLDDGTEGVMRAGDAIDLPAGHDAWTIGDTPFEFIDISPDATGYAVGRPAGIEARDDAAMSLVRRGYTAFNSADAETLISLFANDVTQHVPGKGPLAGTYKGPEAVLGYYGKIAEMTDGTFRADLIDVHGDGHGHASATHQISATRNGVKRLSRGSVVFTFVGDKITDLLELHGDLPGDDAFLS
jgi:ketosteroid isomerase-like protein